MERITLDEITMNIIESAMRPAVCCDDPGLSSNVCAAVENQWKINGK